MTKVSVILTSYNRDRLLRQAIESVLQQTWDDWELYVMDDDSDNPETHAVLAGFDGVGRVRIVRTQLNGRHRFSRCGYSENINRALAMSSGEYIAYLVDDDIYLPDRLERMVRHLDDNPSHMVVYGVQRMVRLNPDFTTTIIGVRNEGLVVPNGACRVDHNSVMHRRECYKICSKDGPFWPEDPSVLGMSDAVVWSKFADHGWPMHRLQDDGPTDEKRYHPDSIQAKGL